MNNTIHQFFHKLFKCSTSIRAVERNVKDAQLTVIYANVIPLVIGANFLAIFWIIKIKQGKFSSPHILFSILFLSDSIIGMIQTDRNLRQVEIKLFNMFWNPKSHLFQNISNFHDRHSGFYRRLVTKTF